MTKPLSPKLAVLAFVVFLLAAPAAGAATSASLEAKSGCDLQVINDWSDNGVVDHTYAIPCYTQAIQRLNTYPDITGYSSAADDIHNALLAAIRQDRGDGPGGGAGGGGNSGPSSGGNNSSNPPPASHGNPDRSNGVLRQLGHDIGPSNAQTIPLPLLVLGGLAVLLLLAALATWLARRFQNRRVTPAAAPAPAPAPRR